MRSNSIFNKLILAAAAATLSFSGAAAQDVEAIGAPMKVACEKSSLTRNYDELTAKMEIDLSDVKVKSSEAAIFTPMIVNGTDTLRLPGVGVYGRTRWYQSLRGRKLPISGADELSMRAGEQGVVKYVQSVDYEDWMNGSSLILQRVDYGCAACSTPVEYAMQDFANYALAVYEPEFKYQTAVAEEVKTRELSGRAFVDFPVNLTTIYPDYRNNAVEIAKIIATIDSVRNDKDVTVTAITIKGFASPEGSYENNIRLAKGRTEALKNYVQQLYMFPYGFIQTDYEPEDWEGLREYVTGSNLPNRDAILAIIDSDLAPDPKNTKIQKDYPQQYDFLLKTVYPGLRHSDYCIEYTIRGFNDVAEIAEVMRRQPSKLSLNELYLLAASYAPGSPEYNEVMETAVMMFPTDETAILNAATAAMQRGDLGQAERYLSKASSSADALYVRGVLAGLQKDYGKAIWYMEQAAAKGHSEAAAELEKIQTAKKYSK